MTVRPILSQASKVPKAFIAMNSIDFEMALRLELAFATADYSGYVSGRT